MRLFYRRRNTLKTTWMLRVAVLLLVAILASVTQGIWAPWIGQSLVCREQLGPGDVILVENFDPNYLLFERAAALQKAGITARVLVPAPASRDTGVANTVYKGIAEVMARVARIPTVEILPIREREPISLTAAYQIRDFLEKEQLKSVLLVTPGFRSRRSALVYQTVLEAAGIQVYCIPVFGEKTPANWTATWHGIQEVTEQLVKLQFYRFYVLPFAAQGASRGP